MSTLEDLDDMEREGKKEEEKKDGDDGDKGNKKASGPDGDAEMKDAKEEEKEEEIIDTEILHSSTRDIQMRKRLLDNDMRIMKSEYQRLTHEQSAMKEKIKDNLDKIENNRFDFMNHGKLRELHTDTFVLQAITIPSRQRRRAPRPRRRKGSSRRGRKYRSRRNPRGQIRSHQNFDPPNHLPSPHRPRRPYKTQAWRPHRRQQRLIPRPRYFTSRIRQPSQGHGGG